MELVNRRNMKKTNNSYFLLISLFFLISCCFIACTQGLPENGEEEGITQIGGPGSTREYLVMHISQDLESDVLLRKATKTIILPPDSGSFSVSVFFRYPFLTKRGILRDEIHCDIYAMSDFLTLKQVQRNSKLDMVYTFEYEENRGDKSRAGGFEFLDRFEMDWGESCWTRCDIVQAARDSL